ncbi:MAG: cysteine desulfurase, partial [Frankiaceae bacterium]|nr:cysteine desulfurase [Frankiaceae bacterium]
ESDNLAVKGIYWARQAADPRRCRILVSAVEHHAVLDTALWLAAHERASITWLDADANGRVSPEVLAAAIDEAPAEVALVSVMWANNEVGTVQPIAELAEVAHAHGIPMHTDAVQAIGQLPVDFAASGVDALTVTGHKFGGPLGAGALLLGRDVEVAPVLHGGGQERDVRSGTLDVPAIAALATAAEIAVKEQPERAERLADLRAALVAGVRAAVPEAQLNGDPDFSIDRRLPGNAHFSFPGCEGDALLMLLDARDIECSTGSACSAGVARPSHVLLAMGHDEARARGSLRFSLGHTSTAADVDALIAAIGPVVERARSAAQ